MPILVTSDDVRRGRAVTGGTGVNGLTKKSKFFRISGVFGLSLDRVSKFITKGPIFWKIGSHD